MDLAGMRVMVVEDELLVSLLIEDILLDRECVIVGPFSTVPTALEAARTEPVDAAILDVNIAGIRVYPVAETLAARGIPFLLVSGYGNDAVPSTQPGWRVCGKPFKTEELLARLVDQIHRAQIDRQ